MTRSVRYSLNAVRDFESIQSELTDFGEDLADRHAVRLTVAIRKLAFEATIWSHFFLTGAPYRAKLFEIGRASFWIVYRLDEAAETIEILRIWNSRQNPGEFEF